MTEQDYKQLHASTIQRPTTRREMLRRMLAGVGIAVAGPALASAHPMYRHVSNPLEMDAAFAKLEGAEWSPEFLNSHQNETLVILSEAIVPDCPLTLWNLAGTLDALGKYVDAIRIYVRLLESDDSPETDPCW